MLLCLLPLLAAVSGYSGTCRELPESYYTPGLVATDYKFVSPWDRKWWEHTKIEFDFDNANKFQDFVINDETYVLLHFREGYFAGSGYNEIHMLNVHYPVNQPDSSSKNGCTDCTTYTGLLGSLAGADGWGWTENTVLWFELEDSESGRDMNVGSVGSQYLEWEWERQWGLEDPQCNGCPYGGGWLCCLEKIEVCQGISPTVSGLSVGNVAMATAVPLSAEEGENVHYMFIYDSSSSSFPGPTKTLNMAFSGSIPVDTDSYIQASFDGEFVLTDYQYHLDSMDREDPSMNVYNFHFDGEYDTWYMQFELTYTGSDWHAPKVQWMSIVNPAESYVWPTVPTTPEGMVISNP